jgi:DmsE family decaheme c-type cytochrome
MTQWSFRRMIPALGSAVVLLTAGAAGAQESSTLRQEKPPAQKIGAECSDCHEKVVSSFASNVHAHVRAAGPAIRCDSCHAGAREHAETGDPAKVLNPSKVEGERASEACLACHGTERGRTFWRGSVHEEHGCAACHSVHGQPSATSIAKPSGDAGCYVCHPGVRADVRKRSHHPLRDSASLSLDGKMTCSSCHNPHGAQSERLIDARSVNDKCYECHTEKKAPVLWEHSPVREDCLICHNAHGSSNDKLLTTRVPRLCQECHMQGRHQSGTLPMNSTFATNRSCLNCQPQVHGSNHPSGTVLQR